MRKDVRVCDNCGAETSSRYNGSMPEGWLGITLMVLPQPVTKDACGIECFRALAAGNALLNITER